MDSKTIQVYNQNAKDFSDRHKTSIPLRLYALAEAFFKKESPTADLGCGIGRDTHWLNNNGFPTTGFDPSEGMLQIAKDNYPNLNFKSATLPAIESLEGQFDNLFSCAVLMHIPRDLLVTSVINILKAVKTQGRIILSYRSGQGETDGRLFEAYHPGQIAQLFESLGGKVLLMEQEGIWHNLVIQKSDNSKREGIQLIQDIVSRDKKTATYKLALIRALCEISRYESHIVTWYREGDMVLVPMKRIAARWVYYYWPLVKSGIRQTTNKNMAFEANMNSLPYKISDMALLRNLLESNELSKEMSNLLNKISNTIKVNPVKYAGGGDYSIFKFIPSLDASVYPELKETENGMVTVPLTLWRDINLFSHWIEDSLTIQWAELTEKINKDRNLGKYLDLITKSIQEDERTTYLVIKLFAGKKLECVWTGRKLEEFAVDHMIPWSLWRNNDFWNLLPAHPVVNRLKSDAMPSPGLIRKRFDSIRRYWEIYLEAFPSLFESQIQRGLGVGSKDGLTNIGREALEQTIIRVNITQGGILWDQ